MSTEAATRLRHVLHRHPELSGRESGTAREILRFFAVLKPDAMLEGLGGNGIAIVFEGSASGPTVLLRCELDALPIQEESQAAYRSATDGVAHKCGHDGHMAILAAVGTELAAKRLARGKVILLFQPAEENGEGAAAVISDPRFEQIRPDYAFALHNLPGYPLGQIITRSGTFSCASRGMAIRLTGKSAHAAQPETGVSPASAMCRIIRRLAELPPGLVPEGEIAFATVVGATLGKRAFGTAPADAEIWVTLRSETDETMGALLGHAEALVQASAREAGLLAGIDYEDVFPATVNTRRAVDIIRDAAADGKVKLADTPFRWSEDFGHFTALSEGAMFAIGAGENIPDLHNADYDFPDALIPVATQAFLRIVEMTLARKSTVKH